TPMSHRRNFLKTSAAALATGLVAFPNIHVSCADVPEPVTGPKKPVRIGAPTYFSESDPDAWARNAREQRYRAVYAPNVPLNDKDRIKAFREAAEQHDLVIAEVGRWVNMMDADPEKRKANLEFVTEGLALADELNAKCCVDIAGSFDSESWFGPNPKNVSDEFFDIAVENARKIIDAVQPKRTVFAYEMVGWAIPDTAESYLRLLRAIDRKGFGVHLDVCNMINSPDKFWNNTRLINETIDLLGQWIVSAHAKDLRWQREMNIHFVECVIGEGVLDYVTLLNRLATLPNDVPLMIEHMNDHAEYLKCRDHLFQVASEANVALEWVG
ncbi:MAG: TIM barrel protein, partial [Planctomycetaceae bacterium]|nr:TIM barrel protein [Planctomycetaceae bacterium]